MKAEEDDKVVNVGKAGRSVDESFTEEERENCRYFFNETSGVTFEDVFIPVTMNRGFRKPAVIHAWWMPAHSSGLFASSGLTVLYTHGNADNISFFKKLYAFLTVELGVNVFAWDFPGFGRSGGDASESSIRAAAEDMMQYLKSKRWGVVVFMA